MCLMDLCEKCRLSGGIIFLVLGIVYMLVTYGYWDYFGINFWSIGYIVIGLGFLCEAGCPYCTKLKK